MHDGKMLATIHGLWRAGPRPADATALTRRRGQRLKAPA